jgi:hypothetical protein
LSEDALKRTMVTPSIDVERLFRRPEEGFRGGGQVTEVEKEG